MSERRPVTNSSAMPSLHHRLLLNASGVSLLLDLSAGHLPAILHWGADLGWMSAADVAGLASSAVPPSLEAHRLAVLPEHAMGWMGRPGLTGSRAGRGWATRFRTTALTVGGIQVSPTVNVGDDPELISRGAAIVEVTATDPVHQLEIVVTIELTPSGLLRSRAELINTGSDPYRVDDLVLAYPVPPRAREVLDLAGRWSKERTPQRRPLVVGTHLREGRKGRTGFEAATVLHVGTPGFGFGEGEIWAVHTAWSGNHTHYAERTFTGEQVIGGGELLLPDEGLLDSGERYLSPWLYGSYGIGMDDIARRFHRFLRSRAEHPGSDRPVTLNVWEAVYFDHDPAKLIRLAELAADIGVERFVLDDGWFSTRRNDTSGLGDWTVADAVWPNGLHPLVDCVRNLGMQFGLWFEPEMVNIDSEVARAHPEWIMAAGDVLPINVRRQQVINLGIPECYAHVRDAMLAILDEYEISYIKWDHNRDLIEAADRRTGKAGVHAQTRATYRLMEELRAAHPGLEIESCSSGGGRVDLGVLGHTDRVWVSDNNDPLDRQQINRWTTQLIPPELMGTHIASAQSHTTGRSHELAFRAGTAVFGHLGIEWDITSTTTSERAELAEWIAFYKSHRNLLLNGDLVRVDQPDPTLLVHGVVASDRSEAIFAHVVLGQSDVAPYGRVLLPGLDRDRRYRIAPVLIGKTPRNMRLPGWWELAKSSCGHVMTGGALGHAGIELPLLAPEQVVLYRIDSVPK
ncbi:alpha-galactosidase [Paenarthrobacter nicotinovorans]|uniref:alpha-galactosidase n=1 Tax=Paenarthrobacter nicotinovorans TaxID=29320 RepID=UPI0027D7FAB5|nr:alpha-galactosidase [Paenarthrobacter nicotinovorans]